MSISSPTTRRDFVRTVGSLAAMSAVNRRSSRSASRLRAVAFDGFAIFDATAVIPTAEAMAPGRGRELVGAWRARHFEYQWLRTLGGRYEDFQTTARDALAFATQSTGITLSEAQRRELVEAQATLKAWPDAAEAVAELRAAGLSLALLSNMTEGMLTDGLKRAGLANDFKFVLSTDRIQLAKPEPRAYAMGQAAFDVPRADTAFVAFAGWDVAGATWFGYPTAWLNRSGTAQEQLGAEPRVTATALGPIVQWIKAEG